MTYSQEIQAFHDLMSEARAHEARCGALVARALQDPPPDPDDDTLDADEDSLAPPPPRTENTR